MKRISLFLVLILALSSCSKYPDELTVTLNESGNLSVRVIDDNGTGVNNAKVSIYSLYSGMKLFYDSTDVAGIVNFGEVLQSEYGYYVIAQRGNMEYTYTDVFQVIAGKNKLVEVNPFINVGDVKLKILNYYSNPIPDIHVALVPFTQYTGRDYTFDELINKAYFIGTTDSNGEVLFNKVPVRNNYYSAVLYYNSDNYDYPDYNNYIYVDRDVVQYFTIMSNFN